MPDPMNPAAIAPNMPMNTKAILLHLTKTKFSQEPGKISDNNPLVRLYTFLDSRAATELGAKIKSLPNVARIQEKTETVINKFRADKSEGAIKAFNMFVDQIQEPTTRASKYTKQFAEVTKAFNDYVQDLSQTMTKLLTQALADNKYKPHLDELRQHDRYKELSTAITSLAREGEKLHADFSKLEVNAKITLAAVAPGLAAEKSKAPPKAEGPAND